MGYKFGVYGGGTGNTKESPASSSQVFATEEEAHRAGDELLMRWFAPSDFVVFEVDEPANYVFPASERRPVSLREGAR